MFIEALGNEFKKHSGETPSNEFIKLKFVENEKTFMRPDDLFVNLSEIQIKEISSRFNIKGSNKFKYFLNYLHEKGHALDPKIEEHKQSLKQTREREALADIYSILDSWRLTTEKVEKKFEEKRGKIVGKRFAERGLNYWLDTRARNDADEYHWTVLYLKYVADVFESLEKKVLNKKTNLVTLAEELVQKANVKNNKCTTAKREEAKYRQALQNFHNGGYELIEKKEPVGNR